MGGALAILYALRFRMPMIMSDLKESPLIVRTLIACNAAMYFVDEQLIIVCTYQAQPTNAMYNLYFQ